MAMEKSNKRRQTDRDRQTHTHTNTNTHIHIHIHTMSDGGIGTVVKKTVNKLDISFHKSKQLHFSTHGSIKSTSVSCRVSTPLSHTTTPLGVDRKRQCLSA